MFFKRNAAARVTFITALHAVKLFFYPFEGYLVIWFPWIETKLFMPLCSPVVIALRLDTAEFAYLHLLGLPYLQVVSVLEDVVIPLQKEAEH